MELISGTIKKTSAEYNDVENSFIISHVFPDLYCAPYSFAIKKEDGEYEAIEVADVRYSQKEIKVYFGSLIITNTDEIVYTFSVTEDYNSNSLSGSITYDSNSLL